LKWTQTDQGLEVVLPAAKPCDYAYGLQIRGRNLIPVPVVNVPIVVEQSVSGEIALNAGSAEIHGASPQIENKAGVDDIGYWNNQANSVSWIVDVSAPGSYVVTVTSSGAPEAEGSSYIVEVAGQSLYGAATSTGSWDKFADHSLGSISFAQTGKHVLTFKPQDPWKGIALRSVTLTKNSDLLPRQMQFSM
jgi:hypothetical protein